MTARSEPRPIVARAVQHSVQLMEKTPTIAADLASVIEAWDPLPPDTRRSLLAIVEAAQGR